MGPRRRLAGCRVRRGRDRDGVAPRQLARHRRPLAGDRQRPRGGPARAARPARVRRLPDGVVRHSRLGPGPRRLRDRLRGGDPRPRPRLRRVGGADSARGRRGHDLRRRRHDVRDRGGRRPARRRPGLHAEHVRHQPDDGDRHRDHAVRQRRRHRRLRQPDPLHPGDHAGASLRHLGRLLVRLRRPRRVPQRARRSQPGGRHGPGQPARRDQQRARRSAQRHARVRRRRPA